MNIFEFVGEIELLGREHHWDYLPFSFTQSNRAKLNDSYDIEVFDLFMKSYEIEIIFNSDRRDNNVKSEYKRNCGEGLIPFTDTELKVFDCIDWTRLPHNLKAHVYDVIWLSNHRYEAARTAAEEYYNSYHEWFDDEYWVQCVNYISRAIELAAKIGNCERKEYYLLEVYNDIIKLNGDDNSFLSISLIELLIRQNYNCDYSTLIPFADRLIAKNKGRLSTAHILEQAYQLKANLFKMQKDAKFENEVYVQYADVLIQEAEKLVKSPQGDSSVDNRNWFMAEIDIKKAIGLFQNHGASEKAVNAQKRLVEIQKDAFKHMPMHEYKYDVSRFYKDFDDTYGNHSIHELIWDVVFAFGFQNKKQIREDVTKMSSISSLFSIQMLGHEGQTEFVLPALDLNDENNILLHMFHKAREYEIIQGETVGVWFIHSFRKQKLQEADLDFIFESNPIIPKGQEKDVQRGVYYGLIGCMSDAMDKLAPKAENIIRNLAEMCGDLMTYYDTKEGVHQKKVLSTVFTGENLNECVEENILFTFDGLLQQKAGSNIRNRVGHGLSSEAECYTGDCIYFVMIVLKFCSLYCESFVDEIVKRKIGSRAQCETDIEQISVDTDD